MKDFKRDNLLFSLCGLNCGLCSMHLDGYCPGCGGGAGNQSCAIARCSLLHEKVQYCFQCPEFPCERYDHIDEYDSFVTHKNQRRDMDKANKIGIADYNAEQLEKVHILKILLSDYNDGRRKTLFCVAVNLLELQDLNYIMKQIAENPQLDTLDVKEKAAYAALLLQDMAAQQNIELKLRKKT